MSVETTIVVDGKTYYRDPTYNYDEQNPPYETDILYSGTGGGREAFYNTPAEDIPLALQYKREELKEFVRLCNLHGVPTTED